MLNLIFLINITLIFIVFVLIINNSKYKMNVVETNMIEQVVSLEENKYFFPFVQLSINVDYLINNNNILIMNSTPPFSRWIGLFL